MPADENTRLRIRQYLIELMDEAAADAMMESMPPIPWTELATKDDITRLDGRLESLDRRVDQTSSDLQELTRVVATQGASLGARMDSIADRLDTTNERIDTTNERMGDLARTVTVGFFSMALTLAVVLIGTIASLFAAGAFS